ncbi:hypothetical protein [Halochromatium roseum]|uniref:hypothetical protein n=1 Tax=Halochromatium roseum TaxID=391920 RepID=UPI00191320F6|nr:hypothetical protein [Halochromatium roseum]MBK5941426.1 hypothetical protein [Halochromatium roseum]
MSDQNAKRRQARFHQRKTEQGYRKLNFWIPERDVERVKAYVARLTKAFERERKADEDNEL